MSRQTHYMYRVRVQLRAAGRLECVKTSDLGLLGFRASEATVEAFGAKTAFSVW